MYQRPVYETEADRQRERAVQEYLLRKIDCLWQEAPPKDNIDGYLFHPNRDLGAVVEIKIRTNRSTAYDTYMLSSYKWRNGLYRAKTLGVPFMLVVKFADGVHYTVVEEEYQVGSGGRYDRNDRFDAEECVFIPMSKFRPL
jgi:hypothetical protein